MYSILGFILFFPINFIEMHFSSLTFIPRLTPLKHCIYIFLQLPFKKLHFSSVSDIRIVSITYSRNCLVWYPIHHLYRQETHVGSMWVQRLGWRTSYLSTSVSSLLFIRTSKHVQQRCPVSPSQCLSLYTNLLCDAAKPPWSPDRCNHPSFPMLCLGVSSRNLVQGCNRWIPSSQYIYFLFCTLCFFLRY